MTVKFIVRSRKKRIYILSFPLRIYIILLCICIGICACFFCSLIISLLQNAIWPGVLHYNIFEKGHPHQQYHIFWLQSEVPSALSLSLFFVCLLLKFCLRTTKDKQMNSHCELNSVQKTIGKTMANGKTEKGIKNACHILFFAIAEFYSPARSCGMHCLYLNIRIGLIKSQTNRLNAINKNHSVIRAVIILSKNWKFTDFCSSSSIRLRIEGIYEMNSHIYISCMSQAHYYHHCLWLFCCCFAYGSNSNDVNVDDVDHYYYY